MPVTIKQLGNLAIFFSVLSSAGCGTIYFLIQQAFTKKQYYTEAIEKLESLPSALEIIGAPPLKVHYLRLGDRYNRVDLSSAQIKIPVSGSRLSANLCSSAVHDTENQRWNLQKVELELNDGQTIPIFPSNLSDADPKKASHAS